jgi:hypothetical protein
MEMSKPSQQKGRRIVTRIVITYVLEDDASQQEHTMELSRERGGDVVDGLIWNRKLMDRLAYEDAPGKCEKPKKRPARPEDGWKRKDSDGAPRLTTMSEESGGNGNGNGPGDGDGEDDCLWFHEESCTWLKLCKPLGGD